MASPKFGRGSVTGVVVDDFLANPDEVRAFALAQQFAPDQRYFRGQRSVHKYPWPDMAARVEKLTGLTIANWAKNPTNGVFQFCVGGDQIVYHSDGNDYAAVLYLTPDAPPEAGTTLYRSKATKGRTVAESSVLTRRTFPEVERAMYADKLLDPTAWEVVDVFGNRYNRLVIWDARLVHAASCYFGTAKENARLFQMFFWDVVK